MEGQSCRRLTLRDWVSVAESTVIDLGGSDYRIATDERPAEKEFLEALSHMANGWQIDRRIGASPKPLSL